MEGGQFEAINQLIRIAFAVKGHHKYNITITS